MKNLFLYNTLTRQKEVFIPLYEGKVGMYTCGPTVHDYQHIGNFRTMIFSDVLVRVLRYNRYTVTSVRNITDIDDKIISKAVAAGMGIGKYTKLYEEIFFEDLSKLNILPVTITTHATEYIPQMVAYIEELIRKGFAYTEDDGSVYFDISKFPHYGKLSNIEKRELKTGTRILSDEYSKDDAQDFALWKHTEAHEVGYQSPWGYGRPGWHIECSVMSQATLGDTLDIHTGGIDLLFPHHENEIAQSEGCTGKPFVRYFVHGGHLLIEDEKMSKSLKNIYTLRDLEHEGLDPLAYRFFTYTAHYRQRLNFSWEAVRSAREGLRSLRTALEDMRVAASELPAPQISAPAAKLIEDYKEAFRDAINDDLNMPRAIAALFEFLKKVKAVPLEPGDRRAVLDAIYSTDDVFGLRLDTPLSVELSPELDALLTERTRAREEKRWDDADRIRTAIEDRGFIVEDSEVGPRLIKK